MSASGLWYKDAVVYQVHVRAFFDANGDGMGDFRGLTQKLDYLQELGVTAIWLLPFYPSPLKDDGYDIASYEDVHKNYGTLNDLKAFLREAHRRGLRVITELVLNHTSDQHPWFQRARRAPAGSSHRDFYVWSDTSEKYRQARVIFQDYETSNWTWDPVARAYYWHRFFHHQPDLNYDHPEVRHAIMRVVDHWMAMGVDGMRLDGVPYLYEREGTTCENLPETHAFLKELRAHVDSKFNDRMFLAEANQWPEDAAAYFGEGDECHTAFHFPLMPRMYMAVQMEDRFPIIDILEQTPEIPENCQWMLFLRNHDELTLEMVTEQERDFMYRFYARDPQARINLGIRRRLAPLMQNDRRKIELLNGLLLSLPGSPVIYYGDEIGMGDNIYMGDRNGVRTPMQWSADRNAGFSRANPQQLYLPPIFDYEYHYETVNVETQSWNPNSLLSWMKRLIRLRQQFSPLTDGSLEFLRPANPKVLAFLRTSGEEHVLVVANLSRFAQFVELDLRRFNGRMPVELFGQIDFPWIGELPYLLTLTPYAFMWFAIQTPREDAEQEGEPVHRIGAERHLPSLNTSGSWQSVFEGDSLPHLERILPEFLAECSWFCEPLRKIRTASVLDVLVPRSSGEDPEMALFMVEVHFIDARRQVYSLPVKYSSQGEIPWAESLAADAILARLVVEQDGLHQSGLLHDAWGDEGFAALLLDVVSGQQVLQGRHGEVVGRPTRTFRRLQGDSEPLEITTFRESHRNSGLAYDQRFFLKLYRRLEEGVHPEIAAGTYLSETLAFPHVAPVAGVLEYHQEASEPFAVGILQGYHPHEQTAWELTRDRLENYLDAAFSDSSLAGASDEALPGALLTLSEAEAPALARRLFGPYLQTIELLGRRTAELHHALSHPSEDTAFEAEPFSRLHQRSIYQSFRNSWGRSLGLLERSTDLPEEVRELADQLLSRRGELFARVRNVLDEPITGLRIRCHGTYRLEEVLFTGEDFVIIDFEGQPDQSIGERRIKTTALRDVASMLHSFRRAAALAVADQCRVRRLEDRERATLAWCAGYWASWTGARFLRSYLEVADGADFIPQPEPMIPTLLVLYQLEECAHELRVALETRPEECIVPLNEALRILNANH